MLKLSILISHAVVAMRVSLSFWFVSRRINSKYFVFNHIAKLGHITRASRNTVRFSTFENGQAAENLFNFSRSPFEFVFMRVCVCTRIRACLRARVYIHMCVSRCVHACLLSHFPSANPTIAAAVLSAFVTNRRSRELVNGI